MDLLQEIKEKTTSIPDPKVRTGVEAAVTHIAVAERWFQRARSEYSSEMFNDVIYRSNQAFEGMLKEAFSVLKKQDASKKTPSEIEKSLKADKIFTSRVLDRFENYRTEWRNPSTHDHRLVFNEQEALLAIISVSAFAVILIDQLIESIGYDEEKLGVQANKREILKRLGSVEDKTIFQLVAGLLEQFGLELFKHGDPGEMKEVEILGRLAAFLETLDLGISTSREVKSDAQRRLAPDLIVTRDSESLIIEVKKPQAYKQEYAASLTQIQRYLELTGISEGIIYIPPSSSSQGIQITQLSKQFNLGKEYSIYAIEPKAV